MFTPQRAGIVGATGPTGRHLVKELRGRGIGVRAISRSRANLERCFPDGIAELAAADALDAAAMRRAVEGCDLVVDCIGLPADRMSDHARTAGVVAEAGAAAGARLLHVSSCWAYLPTRTLPVNENHPRSGGNAYVQARRAAEDILREAGAAVVHLPDFFGPQVHGSSLQLALVEAAAGKTVNWIGGPDIEREYIYVPDAMAAVAEMVGHEEIYGESWIVPGSGPIDITEVANIAGKHLGRQVKVRTASVGLLKVLAWFNSDLRAFKPMLDDYAQPVRYDASRLIGLLGTPRPTPYGESIPETLDWLRRGAR